MWCNQWNNFFIKFITFSKRKEKNSSDFSFFCYPQHKKTLQNQNNNSIWLKWHWLLALIRFKSSFRIRLVLKISFYSQMRSLFCRFLFNWIKTRKKCIWKELPKTNIIRKQVSSRKQNIFAKIHIHFCVELKTKFATIIEIF